MEKVEEPKCSFCGRAKKDVKHLVQGMETALGQRPAICDVCAKVCKNLLEAKPKLVSFTEDDGPKIA